VLDRVGGSITYRFHTRDAHLVLSSGARAPIPFRVLLDGEAPGPSAGVDVNEDGTGLLRDGRMYQPVRQHDALGDRTLEIAFREPGAVAYEFTFGLPAMATCSSTRKRNLRELPLAASRPEVRMGGLSCAQHGLLPTRSRCRGPGRRMSLLGRADECAVLDRLIDDVRRGESRSLVVRGEAGIGKTALLKHLVESASGLTVDRAVGVKSEMELAFASLHQLCGPMLDRLPRLPAPQREALEIVFGLSAGAAPDRFLVALAALSLFSEVADERPLLCVVDDAQWLDHASALTLAFVARRLLAEPVGIVFAAREPGEELQHLSELEVHGLRTGDARALLSAAVPFQLDAQVRDRIIAETRGNPLALLELPRGLTATELAGGFGLIGAPALTGRIEESFVRRLEALPDEARRLALVAAAEPVGDPLLLWRAAERLGIAPAAAEEAKAQGLLAIGARVRFPHPLARSAVYRSAKAQERQAVHRALAKATDRDADPDGRAWHLAAAAAGPDEEVAEELQRSAVRAQARGGFAGAAAFLQRAVVLTGDSSRRVERALAAAEASVQAGAFEVARELLATAEAGPLDELQQARVELLRGQLALLSTFGSDAVPLLLKAARRPGAVSYNQQTLPKIAEG
jgi:hypothetical protein